MKIKYDEKPFDKKRLYQLKALAQQIGYDVIVGATDYVMPSPYKRDEGKNKFVKVHAFAVTKAGEFVSGFDRYEKNKNGIDIAYCNMTLDEVEAYLKTL